MKKIVVILCLLLAFKSEAQLDTSYHAKQIIMNIPDTSFGETVIKRKARLLSMIYNVNDSTLTLVWNIQHYADSADTYGQYLIGFIPDKVKQTRADNTVMVNSSTGAFVYPDSAGNYPKNVKYIGQFNFFQKLAEYQPIIVDNLILQYGANTNWNE